MTRLLATASLFILCAAVAARAQERDTGTGNPAVTTPGTLQSAPTPAPSRPNTADRTFAQEAAIGGMSEVDLGRLAEHEGQSAAVRAFGQQMVADHGKANSRLTQLAEAVGIPLPKGLDAEHRTMQEQLSRLQGVAFDRAFIRGQITDHQRTAQLLEYEIGSGQDAQVKAFASDVLPVVMQHLEMAQNIDAQLSGSSAPSTAAGMMPTPAAGTPAQAGPRGTDH